MSEQIAAAIWFGLAAYALLGVLVWIGLVLGLMKRLDPSAAAAPLRVQAVLAPGLIALWPIVLASLTRRRSRAS